MAACLRKIWSRSQPNLLLFHRVRPIIFQGLKTTSCALGLGEFFPAGVLDKGELAPEVVTTGRRWRAGELRIKSNEDLHKLWYVLLKERNMLNTLMHEAKRQGVPMPSPERYHKVKKSMAIIKLVIGEREIALKDLVNQVWEVDKTAELEADTPLLLNNEESSSERQEEVYPPQAVTLQMSDTEIRQQTSTNLEEEKPTLSPNLLKPT